MSLERKLRKAIKKDCEAPKESFGDWAAAHNVPLDTSRGSRVESVRAGDGALVMRVCFSATLVVIVALLVMFCIIYSVKPPKRYGATSGLAERTTLEEVQSDERIYLPDISDNIQIDRVDKIYSDEDKEDRVLLAYFISNCLLMSGDEYFFLSYDIVLSPDYDYFGETEYSNLGKTIVAAGNNIKYELREDESHIHAFARFDIGEIRYYVDVEEVGTADEGMELTEERFLGLINEIFV